MLCFCLFCIFLFSSVDAYGLITSLHELPFERAKVNLKIQNGCEIGIIVSRKDAIITDIKDENSSLRAIHLVHPEYRDEVNGFKIEYKEIDASTFAYVVERALTPDFSKKFRFNLTDMPVTS